MPRPPSPLWAHFIKVMPNKRATCKYCGLNMCGLVIRMRLHLVRRCTSCPEHVKIEMSTEISHKHVAASSDQPVKKMRIKKDERQEPAPAPDLEQPAAAVPALSHTVVRDDATPSTDVTVLDDKSDLDGYVARAIFGAGLPVATVEHSAFIKMLKRMNPAYDPPSALVLGTSVLDLEYSEVQLKLRAEVLDATTVGLGVESWMTPHNRLLVSCVINQPSPAVFGFESTGKMPHTIEVLVDRIENIMTQIGTGKVSVIVTDTSDDMKQASLSLQHKYPAITFLPSCAHIMNLMVKEMLEMSTIATMIDTCKKLVSFFVQDPAARCAIARVSGHQETTAPLGDPSDASPMGLLQCLFTIERNRNSLDTLLAENGVLNNLNSKVKDEINSLVFWDEISMFTGLFEPFFEIMKMFESDSPLLSTFYHRFTLLWTHLDKYGSHASKFQHIISKHWQSIQHPAIYTAYLLDPRFPPSGLSGEATSEALAYIKRTTSAEVYGSIVDELTRFTARSGLFADDAIWESAQKCSPINWWKGFIGSSCPNLQPMALRTLGFPASSGLSRSKRKMFEKIQVMNSKYMNEDQAGKAAIVYLNSSLVSNVEGGVVNTETLV